ncbi:MAG TPA: hypothetical protein VMU84_01730, partial [Thermoanaerobaculia bacterium]|nr:hypothetical protein [Thermoanaerobaculia bacterium]
MAVALALYTLQPAAFAERRPKPDTTKILIEWADGRNRSLLLPAALGGEDVAQYGNYRVITVPRQEVPHLSEKLTAAGMRFTARDDFDVLFLPGGNLDTRRGVDLTISTDQLIYNYPASVRGLYVVQFIGPTIASWSDAVERAGGRIIVAVPQNGCIVAADGEEADAIRDLPFVQWFGPFHPHFKAQTAPADKGLHDVEIELADVEEAEAEIREIKIADRNAAVMTRFAKRLVVSARLSSAVVTELLRHP